MSIAVQSFIELYVTPIGWKMYDQIWQLLAETGIAYIPFLRVAIKNVIQPYESQETKSATGTSLRRMQVDFLVMIFLIMIGASPFIPLDVTKVSYTPVCQVQGQQTYYAGDTGTTYDKSFTLPTGDVYVPIWWYGWLSISAGFTSAANTLVACIPDYRKMVTEVDMSQINDPALKQELQQFESDCYLPARAQFLQDTKTDSSNNPIIEKDVEQYGQDDTEWLGSHGFQDTYYSNLKATQPVSGFSYDPSEDINADSDQQNPPAYGTPDCNTWWNDSENGLKNKLFKALPQSFYDEFQGYFGDNDKVKDDVIKRIVSNNGGGYDEADNIISDLSYSHLAESVGVLVNQLEAYPKIYAIAQAAPILQGLLLLMCFTFLPFALVFSGYKPQTFLTGGIIIFSIVFCSFIWHLIGWTDSTLIQALYGDNWFEHQGADATLTDMIIGLLQIAAPLFWFGFMSSLGVAVGSMFATLSAANTGMVDNPASSAANKGFQTLKSGATQAVKIGSKFL